MLPTPCQVRRLLSFPVHGHSSSCPSCLGPLPLSRGWPCLGVRLCGLTGFLLPRDLLTFTVHLSPELFTCLLAGITASSGPPHHPSSSGSGNGKSHLTCYFMAAAKGRNYYKKPKVRGENISRLSSVGVYTHEVLPEHHILDKSSSYKETVLLPHTVWRSVFPQVPWDHLSLSPSLEAGAGLHQGDASAE